MDPLSTGPSRRALPSPASVRGSDSRANLTPEASRDLAAAFTLQMQSASNGIGAVTDSSDESSEGGDAGMSLGLDPKLMTMASMMPLLGSLAQQPGIGGLLQALVGGVTGAASGGGIASALGAVGNSRTSATMAKDGACQLEGAGASSGTAFASTRGASGGGPRGNAAIVADEARKAGVDPVTAVAMMLAESGGRSRAVGDGGSSFGLFQLHRGGMLTAAGLTPEQAFDPRTNASVALRSLAHQYRLGPNRSPGAIAAASQRPADPTGYAARVNALLPQARQLLGL